MEITDIKVRKLMHEGRLRGIVSVTLDGILAVHDIKIVEGDKRLFAAMPSRKDEQGNFRDIVHPIGEAPRRALEEAIISAFREAESRAGSSKS